MPIVSIFEFPGETVDKYEKVFSVGGSAINNQPERLSHVCFPTPEGFTVIDVWTDEAAFAAFGEIIGPASAQAGLDAKPVVYEVQGLMLGDGVRNP